MQLPNQSQCPTQFLTPAQSKALTLVLRWSPSNLQSPCRSQMGLWLHLHGQTLRLPGRSQYLLPPQSYLKYSLASCNLPPAQLTGGLVYLATNDGRFPNVQKTLSSVPTNQTAHIAELFGGLIRHTVLLGGPSSFGNLRGTTAINGP